MTNHPNRAKFGVIKTSDGRTSPSYAVMERLSDGSFATYMRHHDIEDATRAARHRTRSEAEDRFNRLEVDAAMRR